MRGGIFGLVLKTANLSGSKFDLKIFPDKRKQVNQSWFTACMAKLRAVLLVRRRWQ